MKNYLSLTFRMCMGIFFLLGIGLFNTAAQVVVDPDLPVDPAIRLCSRPPVCIVNGDLNPNGPNPSGNMNDNPANTINAWYISHGTPSIWSGAPSGNGYGVWMWSYNARGEGIFTCYSFKKGRRYEICFWVMNTSPVTAGNLMVFAANGLAAVTPVGFGGPVPVPASSQLISSSFVHSPFWTQVTYVFTPNDDYNQFWIYPYMAGGPVNDRAYELAVDIVRVRDMEREAVDLNIEASTERITWCEQARLCASGSPTGNYYWTPGGIGIGTRNCIYVSPCSTTTYTVETDGDLCLSCRSKNSFTLEVVPPEIEAYSNGPVRCGDKIELWAKPDVPCATFEWYDPNGNHVGTGQSITIPNADPDKAGTYRVEVSYGGCTVVQYVTVEVVDCPCEFRAKFDYKGCNPIQFFDVSGGYGTSVAWFWEFGDGSTSTDQNPVHMYSAEGVYVVCLTVIRKVGRETCCNRVCMEVRACRPPREQAIEVPSEEPQPPRYAPGTENGETRTDVSSDIKRREIEIIPNPATDHALLIVKNMDKPALTLRDMKGTALRTAKPVSDGRYLLDLNGLTPGVYIVVAEDASGRQTAKLIKN